MYATRFEDTFASRRKYTLLSTYRETLQAVWRRGEKDRRVSVFTATPTRLTLVDSCHLARATRGEAWAGKKERPRRTGVRLEFQIFGEERCVKICRKNVKTPVETEEGERGNESRARSGIRARLFVGGLKSLGEPRVLSASTDGVLYSRVCSDFPKTPPESHAFACNLEATG